MEYVQSALAEAFTGGALLANLSYALLIVAMLMSRVVWLRFLAIASGIAGVTYFWFFLGDRVASVWEMLFIVANFYQLALTAYRDRMSRFGPDEMLFRNACIPGLSPSDARRLLKIARIVEAPAGAYLTHEHRPVPALAFILDGEIEIRVGEQRIGICGHADFIGEIGVMSGGPATASALALTPVRYFSFEAAALRHLMNRDRTIAQELELSFRQGLREKLVRANAALAGQAAALTAQNHGRAGSLRGSPRKGAPSEVGRSTSRPSPGRPSPCRPSPDRRGSRGSTAGYGGGACSRSRRPPASSAAGPTSSTSRS
jgi:CRP-like cAMP-binding protein